MSGSKSSFAKVCSKYTGHGGQRSAALLRRKRPREKKKLRTPLSETLVVVTQTDAREAGGAEECDERRHGHAAEERPVDKGETIDARVEHHGPREYKEERDGEESPCQLAPFTAYGEPALHGFVSALAEVIAR